MKHADRSLTPSRIPPVSIPRLDLALVERSPGETRVALLAGEQVWELHHFRDDDALVGDLFLGRVRGRAPAGAAVFVDLGMGPDGFLAAEDCPQGLPPDGALVLVEILLAARAEKGPKLTASVSLGSELLAYSPGRPGISLSGKITHKAERTRLQQWAEQQVRPDEGVVLRTRAWDADEQALTAALSDARARWADLDQKRRRLSSAGRLSGGALPLAAALEGRSVERVLCAGPSALQQAQAARPDLMAVIRAARAPYRLWDDEGISEAIDQALSPRCGLLTIEQTAALTAIDVDSGPYSPEEANQRVLPELARQIRLRNLAGMIVIDFAAPRRGAEAHKKAMAQSLAALLADDPARPQVLGVSALGLVEVRRPRRGAPLADLLLAPRPVAASTAQAAALDALRQVLAAVNSDPVTRIALRASAAVIDGLRGPWRHALTDAEQRLGQPLVLQVVTGVARDWFSVTPLS
ncbi:ribonuclease E/G [Insolitispirillum peregrinum]